MVIQLIVCEKRVYLFLSSGYLNQKLLGLDSEFTGVNFVFFVVLTVEGEPQEDFNFLARMIDK